MSQIEANQPDEQKAEQNPVIRALLAEEMRLVRELSQVRLALKQQGFDAETKTVVSSQRIEPAPTNNLLHKVQALRKALETATTPLTPREMVFEMNRLGYTFESKNPANTLNPYLYGRRQLPFVKRFGRGFILADREQEFEQMQLSREQDSPPNPSQA